MYKLILEIDGGIVTSVYTDSREEYQVQITDTDDDLAEREQMEKLIDYQIKQGILRDVLCGNKEEEKIESARVPSFDPRAILLVRESDRVKTSTGKFLQKMDVAFIDGFLSASGKISRYITSLYKTKNPTARIVYNELKPLNRQLNGDYNSMCLRLNQEDYDSFDVDGEDSKNVAEYA